MVICEMIDTMLRIVKTKITQLCENVRYHLLPLRGRYDIKITLETYF